MTSPWADARVEAELDLGNIDAELRTHLERAVAVATRKCQRHFAQLEKVANKHAKGIARAFDTEFKGIDRSAATHTAIAGRAFGKLAGTARRQFAQIGDHFDREMRRLEQRAAKAVVSINRTLGRINQNTAATITVTMTGADVADIRQMASALRAINKLGNNVAIVIDVSVNGLAQIRELQGLLRSLPRRVTTRVDADVNRRGSREVSNLHRGLSSLGSIGSTVGRSILSVGRSALAAAGTIGKFASIAGAAVLAVGSLVPLVGALGAGLTAVGGAAGTVAVAGLFAAGIAAGTLKAALSGVGDALSSALDPEKAEEFEKALAKLAPSAQSAVRAMQGLGRAFKDDIQPAVQQKFFQGLGGEISKLSQFMGPLRNSLVYVAGGFNDGANRALNFINTAEGAKSVNGILFNGATIAGQLGNALARLLPGFLAIGHAATSVVSDMLPMKTSIGDMAGEWSRNMTAMANDGTLQEKMKGLVETAKQFGAVLGQIGGIIGGVFAAAKAAGGDNPFANIMGSLQQINGWVHGEGAAALTSFFQASGQAVGALMPILLQVAGIIGGTVAPMIAQLITAVAPTLEMLVGMIGQAFSALQPAIAPLSAALASIGQAIAPVIPVIGQLISSFVQIAGPVLSSLVSALAPVIQTIGEGLISVMQALQPAVEPIGRVFQALSPVLSQIASVLADVLVGAIAALVPVIETIANGFSQWMEALSPLIPIIGDVLTQIIEALAPMMQTFADAWLQVVEALIPLVPPLMQIVQALLPPLIEIITALLPILTISATVFGQLVAAIAPIVTILAQVIAWFAQLLGTILGFVASALGAIVGFVTSVVTGFTGMVSSVISTVSGWVSDVLGWFSNLVSSAVSFVTGLWNDVSNGFSTGVSNAVNFVKELPGKILDALSGAGTWLLDTGRKIIGGLIDGIKSMAGAIVNALVNLLPGPLRGAARSALGLALGGWIPHLATGGLTTMGGGEVTGGATTQIKPGGFIVNARQTRRNRDLLQRLAPTGRVLSGPGTGTSDSITGTYRGAAVARVSRGEFYAPPEAAAGLMPLLTAINAGRKLSALLAAGGVLPAFAPGGMLPNELLEKARQSTSSGYVWGGWGNGWNTDCSGLTSSLANMASGRETGPGVGERTATGGMRAFLSARDFVDGAVPGALQIGWSGTHSAATLPTGENIEHTGPEGSPPSFGADAKGATSLPEVMSLPMGGDTDSGATGLGTDLGSTGTSSGGSTPIGSGTSGSSWGNSGGTSTSNSAKEAKSNGLTPVWVENWPASIGGGGGAVPTGNYTAGVDAGGPTGVPAKKELKQGASKQDMADAVYRIGKEKGMSDEEILAAMETMLAESDGKNYANSNVAGSTDRPHDAVGSDHASVGVMQQQVGMGWGELDQLMDPEYAIGRFYDEMKKNPGDGPAHQRAQAVQRSAFADGSNYQAKEAEASKLIEAAKANAGSVPTTPAGNVPVEIANPDPSTPSPDIDVELTDPANTNTDTPETPETPAPDTNTPELNTPDLADTGTDPQVPENRELPSLSGSPSAIGGDVAKYAVGDLFDEWLEGHPELTEGLTGALGTAVTGQLSAGLGIFGLDQEPTWLTAFNEFRTGDSGIQGDDAATKKDLRDLVNDLVSAGFGQTTVTINGDADAQKVTREIDKERKRKMRRSILT